MPFRASQFDVRNTTCAVAKEMIQSGPKGRVARGWVCPVTGDKTYTSCKRGDQFVAWHIG